MKLDNRVAIVTGAGSGIGRAMATLFAAEGARVVVADIVAERVDETVAAIRTAGGEATGFVGDVSSPEDVARMIDLASETYGRLDILCNNAGIMDRMAPAADVPLDLWERVLRINLTGPFLACRKAIPLMRAQGGGVILNTASVAGLHGGRAGAAYTASKHGVIGLTRNIAYMYATEGIRCNAICPGGTETAIGLGGEPNEFGLNRMQLGAASMPRTGKPEEIARVALHLVSDDSSFVNGAVVVVDGGWSAY
ncbi:glucose 1-dehydrogenase [Litorilinea aerophila]|uniref:Glucose 1-dehydrogenase n=1 Tax=Litorilinea aerophila TaxID=1204385 RepID=A0A540V8Q4_9CHLR|nr:glucose 1-dehydrogenase [Litorilinea aerophila]MCC9078913.1 glucose 1-dehydrogenase [Litorilinea aerophila]GIV76030.1 MAG: 3-ketoacyl-ACP reductase [Litorilinea sp.]